jgi:uracil-DNA glycosylase
MEMLMNECTFNCDDVDTVKHFIDISKIDCPKIHTVIISESYPKNGNDYFDGQGVPSYIKNTNYLFNKNNIVYEKYNDYLANGIYLTTAIKCTKKDYLVSSETIKNCSFILEKEMDLFPNVKIVLLMGDVAIKAVNYIWKRKDNVRIIPNGSTYKIRNEKYVYNGITYIPSYTQTGDSFGIEKGKILMMIEDIGKAICLDK